MSRRRALHSRATERRAADLARLLAAMTGGALEVHDRHDTTRKGASDDDRKNGRRDA